ncbi:MAG: lipopolysaccharide biosynthesis protein [Anaerolineae bacterium]
MLLKVKQSIAQLTQSKLMRSAAIYTITGTINSGIPFLLLPILTRYLDPEQYGIVAMFSSIILIVLPFIGLNVQSAIGRQYLERDTINFPEYVRNSVFIIITTTVLVSSLFLVINQFLIRVTEIPWPWIVFIPFMATGRSLVLVLLVLLQMRQKPHLFGVVRIGVSVIDISLSLFFVIGLSLNWTGRLGGQIIAEITAGVVVLFILTKKKWSFGQFNRQYIQHAFNYGAPLIPHTFGVAVILLVDKFFITAMVGVEATGVYDVGYKVGMILSLLQNAFNQAYVPWLFEKLKINLWRDKIRIVRFTYIYFVVIVFMAIGLTVLAPTFLSIYVGEAFQSASQYVFWIAMSFAFSGMYKMVTNYIFFAEKTYLLSYVTFATAIVNVVLNYLFIRQFGAIGAAQATFFSFFLSFVLTFWLSSRVFDMPWLEFGLVFGRTTNDDG